jgi:hypothetical protein
MLAALALPAITFADGKAILGLFNLVLNLMNGIIVPLIFAVAFLVFIFQIYRYFIASAGNEEKVQEGQKFLAWSLVGFFVMFSIWGLVNLLVGTFGFNNDARPGIPTFGDTPSGQTTNNPAPTGATVACNAADTQNNCPISQTCVNGFCVPIQ